MSVSNKDQDLDESTGQTADFSEGGELDEHPDEASVSDEDENDDAPVSNMKGLFRTSISQ